MVLLLFVFWLHLYRVFPKSNFNNISFRRKPTQQHSKAPKTIEVEFNQKTSSLHKHFILGKLRVYNSRNFHFSRKQSHSPENKFADKSKANILTFNQEFQTGSFNQRTRNLKENYHVFVVANPTHRCCSRKSGHMSLKKTQLRRRT